MIFIETPRLILREWKKTDLEPLQKMNNDPMVMEFFLNKLSFSESKVFFDKIQHEIEERGYGFYAVELRESKEFIGFTGFHFVDLNTDFCPCVEISWRYLSKAWGNGYATEAAIACFKYAKDQLGLDEVYSFTTLSNKRSQNVMKRIGMKKVGDFLHPLVPNKHHLREHVLYKIELQ